MRLAKPMLGITALTLVSALALAAGLPGYYPPSFGFIGTVNAVYRHDHRMVVNDHSITFSPQMQVHTPDTRYGTNRQIQAGMKVAIDPPPWVNNEAREVWVLPKDFKQPEGRDR